MAEWNLENTIDWLVQKCWEYHKRYPDRPVHYLMPEDLGQEDPPFKLVCEAAEYLQGKGWVTVKFEGVFCRDTLAFIKIKLTPQAIASIQDQMKQKPRHPIGFRTED